MGCRALVFGLDEFHPVLLQAHQIHIDVQACHGRQELRIPVLLDEVLVRFWSGSAVVLNTFLNTFLAKAVLSEVISPASSAN